MTLRRIIVALVDRMECDPITREVWLTLRLPNVKPGKLGAVDEPVFCLDSNTFQNTAPETNNLLLAEVHLSFVSEVVFRKRLTSFKNFRYAITGGILKCDGEHELAGVEPPQPPPAVMKAAHFDLDALEDAGWCSFTPWTFWTPTAA